MIHFWTRRPLARARIGPDRPRPPIGAVVLLAGFVAAACGSPAETPAFDHRYPVVDNGRWGYIDRTGSLVIEPQFERAWPFSEERALVALDGRFGFIDPVGRLAIPANYIDAWYFSGGLAPVQDEDSAWTYINPDGVVVTRPRFRLQTDLLENETVEELGLGRVRVGDRYGFRNAAGQIVIDPQFEQAWHFAEGLARVRTNGLWGFIDQSGQAVIPPQFDAAWDFEHGLALVRVDDEYGYIDRNGQAVWPPSR